MKVKPKYARTRKAISQACGTAGKKGKKIDARNAKAHGGGIPRKDQTEKQ